jgi:hypothetical protein
MKNDFSGFIHNLKGSSPVGQKNLSLHIVINIGNQVL